MNDQIPERVLRSSLALCLCYAVVACGGGSDEDLADGTAPLPAPVETSTPATEPEPAIARARRTTTPVPAPVTTNTAIGASCGLNGAAGIQAEVLQRVNALRAAGAVCGATTFAAAPPLNWNSLLLQAATGHSSDMAQKNYFSHNSLDGRTFAQRITAAGYRYTAAGENIAAGQTTVQSVITTWINSPGHCQNLMNATFRDIGVACVRNDAASYRFYWTLDLGRT